MADIVQDQIECRVSRPKMLGLVFLGLLMTAAAWFCTTLGSWMGWFAGWFGVVFFGICCVLATYELVCARSRIVIDNSGIYDFRYGAGCIPWEEIVSITVREIESQQMLNIEVTDPDIYLNDMPRWRRALARNNGILGFDEIVVSFTGLSPGFREALVVIKRLHPELLVAQ